MRMVSGKRNVACLMVRYLLDMREEPREDGDFCVNWSVGITLGKWFCMEMVLVHFVGRGFM